MQLCNAHLLVIQKILLRKIIFAYNLYIPSFCHWKKIKVRKEVQLSWQEIFIPWCSCPARVELAVGIIKKYSTLLWNNQALIDDCACRESTCFRYSKTIHFLNAILYFQSYFYLFWFFIAAKQDWFNSILKMRMKIDKVSTFHPAVVATVVRVWKLSHSIDHFPLRPVDQIPTWVIKDLITATKKVFTSASWIPWMCV